MQYKIYEEHEERLDKKMASLQRKFNKNGATLVYKKIGEEFEPIANVDVTTGETTTIYRRWVVVDIDGTYRINDWIVIGKRVCCEESNDIIAQCYNVKYAEQVIAYKNTPIFCDHCKTGAKRLQSYIILNIETMETMQVGSACLKEFLGINAEIYGELYSTVEEFQKLPCGSGCRKYYDVKYIIDCAIQLVDNYGYTPSVTYDKDGIPTHHEDSTTNAIKALMHREQLPKKYIGFKFTFNDVETENKRQSIIDFINKVDINGNGFIANAKLIINNSYVDIGKVGILAACVQFKISYDREQERLSKLSSEFVGNVGDKIELKGCSIKLVTSYESEYGYVYVYRIENNGNVFIWKTSKIFDVETATVKGTIKGYSTYRDEKQTVLTRVKFLED